MSTDLHTLTGAFALDALSSGESEEFHRHLKQCDACRDEVREFQAVAAQMAAIEAVAPPAALRARVLAAAAQQAQLPPVVKAQPTRRWWATAGGIAAAVVLVAGTAIGVQQLQDEQPQKPPSQALSPVQRVFEAPDARIATVRGDNGGRLQVATSTEVGQVALATRRLPVLNNQVYQAWTVRPRPGHPDKPTITSQGVIRDARAGKVLDLPAEGTLVAISVEPPGGSDIPTTVIAKVDPAKV